MKYASLFQKATKLDASVMPASRILEMATINGAKALGLDGEIGSLEVGKKADLIAIDLNTPRLTPVHSGKNSNILQHIVYAAHGDDVDTVMIDGKIVLEGKKLRTLSEGEIVKRATEAARQLISKI
jgi:5-methylthioadenosine/S-adenosylhomocysteine deaminase